MTFTHSGGAVVSWFDDLPNKLLFVWLQLPCVQGRGGVVPVFEGAKIRISKLVLIKKWQVTHYLI